MYFSNIATWSIEYLTSNGSGGAIVRQASGELESWPEDTIGTSVEDELGSSNLFEGEHWLRPVIQDSLICGASARTLRIRPSIQEPFSRSIASSASSIVSKVTFAIPRFQRVQRSLRRWTTYTSPHCLKCSITASAVVLGSRPLAKTTSLGVTTTVSPPSGFWFYLADARRSNQRRGLLRNSASI